MVQSITKKGKKKKNAVPMQLYLLHKTRLVYVINENIMNEPY